MALRQQYRADYMLSNWRLTERPELKRCDSRNRLFNFNLRLL